jgi:hypothetical protein
MSEIKELIEVIKKDSECQVHPPSSNKIELEITDDLI